MPIILLIILLFTYSVSADELTIVYTGGSNGKLMACDCPNDPYGGLSERVTLMGDLRDREKTPLLLLDAGNAVGLFGDYDLKAESVFRIMNLMKYDFIAAGRNEVYRGVDRIVRAGKKASFPLLSASFVSPEAGTPLFAPFMTKRVGDLTVAVTALCDSSTFAHVKDREYDFAILSPETALKNVLDVVTPHDVLIVLSQMSPERNRAFLERFPCVDLIVEASTNHKYDPPVVSSHGVIVSPGASGAHVGLITLDKSGGKVTVKRAELIPVLDIPQDDRAGEIAVRYYQKRK